MERNYLEIMYTDFSILDTSFVDQAVTVGGFVHTIRDHGGLIFIDLRSQNSILQCVIDPVRNPEVFKVAETIHGEYVLQIQGTIQARSKETINENLSTGKIELVIKSLEIISKAKAMPFDIHAEGKNLAGEDTRLKYRYLDLRREKIKKMLINKHKLTLSIRNWFDKEGFVEIQTPILANSSPEGARDFLIPSRLHPGKFYALPQSPQQFKQLLMVGGFNKYFQIAPCFRDEDPRADRHPGDFYQIDAEIAWADEDQIFELSSRLIRDVFANYTDKVLDPEITKLPYLTAMDAYGSDKPDLRFDLAFRDAKELFFDTGFKVFADLAGDKEARIQALVIPKAAALFSRSDLDKIQDIGRENGLPGIAYIQYMEDGAKSPIFKFFGDEKDQEIKKEQIAKYFSTSTGDLILFIANSSKQIVWKAQNQIRLHIAKKLNLIDETKLKFVWIYDFPFFEKDEKTGDITFTHNPFSMWQGGVENLLDAQKNDTLTELKARQYDIACNGYEVLSGGVRNRDPQALVEIFKILGHDENSIKTNFGHMLEAYEFGAPWHAGFAWGMDRLFMILIGEENIRETIAFPKNGSAMDVMMASPSLVQPRQLRELKIKVE